MFLDETQIAANVRWLLHHGSPPVRYLTHRDILGTDPQQREMTDLWAEVERWEPVQDIFAKQEPDGSWCAGGAWASGPSYIPQEGYEPTTPKYVTTAWILPLLGDMGFDRRDPRIRRACNHTLTYQWANGFFAAAHGFYTRHYASRQDEVPNTPCHFALYLLAFASVGMAGDPQLKKSFDLLISWQRDDGGWLDNRHLDGSAAPYKIWTRGCPWSTYHAASALYRAGLSDYDTALHRALEFLVRHLSQKDERDIRQLFFHGHNPVKELVMLSETGVGLDTRPVTSLLEWFMTMYDPRKGSFKYRGKSASKYSVKTDGVSPRVMKYRLYLLAEDDWLTYYLTRVGANLLKSPRS